MYRTALLELINQGLVVRQFASLDAHGWWPAPRRPSAGSPSVLNELRRLSVKHTLALLCLWLMLGRAYDHAIRILIRSLAASLKIYQNVILKVR